jgi:hypothetical protein
MKKLLSVLAATAMVVAGCSTSTTPKPTITSTSAPSGGPITYTVEPYDMDGAGTNMSVTQAQLGGTQCPCVKIPYPATAMPWDVQTGANNILKLIQAGTIKPGDTVMGFSLGSQTIALFLSQHSKEIPSGIKFLLLGWTFWRNQQDIDQGSPLLGTGGIPWDIANQVHLVANEGDGYSDQPEDSTKPNYALAQSNANAGEQHIHNYAFARLGHAGNIITTRGNITAELVPTKMLPLNDGWRTIGMGASADSMDATQRPQIRAAYVRQSPTDADTAAAADEQVPVPAPAFVQTPEPAAAVPK